jgi:hypothetical protein
MPMAMMVQSANSNLGAGSLPRLVTENPKEVAALGRPGTLVEVATRVLKLDAAGRNYLQAIPSPLREAMRAAIYDALSDGQSVQISYSPHYDFELRFTDYGEALSIHVKGPFDTASPGRAYRARAKRARSGKKSTARKPARRKASVRKTGARRPQRRGS